MVTCSGMGGYSGSYEIRTRNLQGHYSCCSTTELRIQDIYGGLGRGRTYDLLICSIAGIR